MTVVTPEPPPVTTPPPSITVPPTTTRPPAPPTTIAPPATLVASIPQLIALLAPNPDAYGDRGSNLYDKLVHLQEERASHGDGSPHVRDEARDLLDDVNKWLDEGRLNAAIGAEAIRLLTPLA